MCGGRGVQDVSWSCCSSIQAYAVNGATQVQKCLLGVVLCVAVETVY